MRLFKINEFHPKKGKPMTSMENKYLLRLFLRIILDYIVKATLTLRCY